MRAFYKPLINHTHPHTKMIFGFPSNYQREGEVGIFQGPDAGPDLLDKLGKEFEKVKDLPQVGGIGTWAINRGESQFAQVLKKYTSSGTPPGPAPDPIPDPANCNPWIDSKAYPKDACVKYAGKEYTAIKAIVAGIKPDSTLASNFWKAKEAPPPPVNCDTWIASKVYPKDACVKYAGKEYTATKAIVAGIKPDSTLANNFWKAKEAPPPPVNCNAWDKEKTYDTPGT